MANRQKQIIKILTDCSVFELLRFIILKTHQNHQNCHRANEMIEWKSRKPHMNHMIIGYEHYVFLRRFSVV